jgi:hypothetical protein
MRRSSLLLFLGLGLCVLYATISYSRIDSEQLPRGEWTLGFHPYLREGYNKVPVVVSSVTSKLDGGATVTGVGMLNRSGKRVGAVKFSWYLSTDEDPTSVLLHGETPLVALSGGLPANGKSQAEFPVVSFAKIYKPLLKEGVLTGHFRIEIGVTEIIYEDGSTWPAGRGSQSATLRDSRAVAFTKTVARDINLDDDFCPKQNCVIDSGGGGYSCQSSSSNEYCTNNVTSCTNSICSSGSIAPLQ